MSADGSVWGMCDAYGCPLFGIYGVGSKWFCFCHFRAENGAQRDAITLVLNQNRPLVDISMSLRRKGSASADLLAAENELIALTRDVGMQHSIPTGGVVGPKHAMPHFSENDR